MSTVTYNRQWMTSMTSTEGHHVLKHSLWTDYSRRDEYLPYTLKAQDISIITLQLLLIKTISKLPSRAEYTVKHGVIIHWASVRERWAFNLMYLGA